MPEAHQIEWRDSNDDRKYPFSAGAGMQADTGLELPDDAFLDAVFYPIDLSGSLYLSKIDKADGLVEIADSADGSIKGTAAIVPGTELIEFGDEYGRPTGTLVTGPGFDSLSNITLLDARNATFAAACVFPQNQRGVRGFLLPDGTLVTGVVIIRGENGIRADSAMEDGKFVIRLQAAGVGSSSDCIDLPPAVKCLRVSQVDDSNLTIEQSTAAGGILLKLGARVNMCDICPDKNVPDEDGVLPLASHDPCGEDPPQPPMPWPPDPGFGPLVCEGHNGRYFLISDSDLLAVEPSAEPAAIGTSLEGATLEGLQDVIDLLPPRAAQAINIRVKGW